MVQLNPLFEPERDADGVVRFHFTPGEWRRVLEDRAFLQQEDNAFQPPRRLMGVPVRIVPDHSFG